MSVVKVPTAKKAILKKTVTVSKPPRGRTAMTKNVTKPAIKKSVVKKIPPRTTRMVTTKTRGKRPLVTAPDQKSFWVSDGQILNDLVALANSFESMNKLIYSYHVQKSHNDFAEWVETVLEDPACATALRKARSPKTARAVIIQHLKYYIV